MSGYQIAPSPRQTVLERYKAIVFKALKEFNENVLIKSLIENKVSMINISTVTRTDYIIPKIIVMTSTNWNCTNSLIPKGTIEPSTYGDSIISLISFTRNFISDVVKNIVLNFTADESARSISFAEAFGRYIVSQMKITFTLWGDGITLDVKPTFEDIRKFMLVVNEDFHNKILDKVNSQD